MLWWKYEDYSNFNFPDTYTISKISLLSTHIKKLVFTNTYEYQKVQQLNFHYNSAINQYCYYFIITIVIINVNYYCIYCKRDNEYPQKVAPNFSWKYFKCVKNDDWFFKVPVALHFKELSNPFFAKKTVFFLLFLESCIRFKEDFVNFLALIVYF